MAASFPEDFPVPLDQGGPGKGQHIGGFGGNPALDRSGHRAVVQRVGKAPVLLVHGNAGAADRTDWDMLDLKRMLNGAGYPDEILWAPSYLGPGVLDDKRPFPTPHTNNVDEVREFIDRVCEYLEVDVIDVIGHSLGCSLVYAICRGLEKRVPPPVNFNQPKRWHRLGTFVALAGAFHGLRPPSAGEWTPGGEFMAELLAEDAGGGGETPYGKGRPQTHPPIPHNITYLCGIAKGDFVDASLPGTGKLAGAVNREYDRGPFTIGHERIKEDPVVFSDFLPLLNAVPPAPPATITVSPPSGGHPSPLGVALSIVPTDVSVEVEAIRISKAFANGLIAVTKLESLQRRMRDGETLTLPTAGVWELVFSAHGAVDDVDVTYWVGIEEISTTIVTDNSTPFQGSLTVIAATSNPRASLYCSLGRDMWNEAANVTITENAVVSFIAIDPSGNASAVASKAFKKRVVWERQETANVNEHFLAGRIDADEFQTFVGQFGLTRFTLYLVDGDWVLDPISREAPRLTAGLVSGAAGERLTRTYGSDVAGAGPAISVGTGDPRPGRHEAPVAVTLEAVDARRGHLTVFYSQDGSVPGEGSPSFTGQKRFDFIAGNHVIACYAKDSDGSEHYETFHYSIRE
jgi:pimeloyl-ACP methyl ester carboxylesterase